MVRVASRFFGRVLRRTFHIARSRRFLALVTFSASFVSAVLLLIYGTVFLSIRLPTLRHSSPCVGTPPTYYKLDAWERNLPQHNLDLPFPEGRTGRYVKFSNQIQYLGWNNVFNEMWV
jgi:hypothetical protein